MREEISKLVREIGSTIKGFSRGSMSLEDAESACSRLQDDYLSLEAELKNENARGIMEGVLYNHNAANFSLHSGLYLMDKKDVSPLFYYGDGGIAERTAAALLRNRGPFNPGEIQRLGTENTEGLSLDLHVTPVSSTRSLTVLFAALSSSPYFSPETFAYTGSVLNHLLDGNALSSQNYCYFAEIRRTADIFITANLDRSHDIMTTILIFRNIEKIFNHLGFFTLIDVSDSIKSEITGIFPRNSLCINPSLRMYLVFTRHMKGRDSEIRNIKTEFRYRGISLPHQRLHLPLEMSDHRESFWYDVFQFEDYVISGDRF